MGEEAIEEGIRNTNSRVLELMNSHLHLRKTVKEIGDQFGHLQNTMEMFMAEFQRNFKGKVTASSGEAGCGIGGMLSAIHGFNTGIPYVQKHVKGPKWLPFVIGVPPLLMFSAASAAFGGYALPKFAQLTVTSYYAASSASHYGISLLTRRVEEANTSPRA